MHKILLNSGALISSICQKRYYHIHLAGMFPAQLELSSKKPFELLDKKFDIDKSTEWEQTMKTITF